jgi:hypothetical protein
MSLMNCFGECAEQSAFGFTVYGGPAKFGGADASAHGE